MGLERCMLPEMKLCKEMTRASLAGSALCLPPNRDAFLHLCHHWDAGEHRELSMLPWAQRSWRDTSSALQPCTAASLSLLHRSGCPGRSQGQQSLFRSHITACPELPASSLLVPVWGCGDSAGQHVQQLLPNHSLFILWVFKIIPNPCLPGRKDVVSIASHPNRCIATRSPAAHSCTQWWPHWLGSRAQGPAALSRAEVLHSMGRRGLPRLQHRHMSTALTPTRARSTGSAAR